MDMDESVVSEMMNLIVLFLVVGSAGGHGGECSE